MGFIYQTRYGRVKVAFFISSKKLENTQRQSLAWQFCLRGRDFTVVHLIGLQGYVLSVSAVFPTSICHSYFTVKFLLCEEQVWSISNEAIYCVQVHDTKDQVHNLVVANTIGCFIPQGIGVKVFNLHY